MILKHAQFLAALLALSGCQKPSDEAAQIAALKAQVNDLSGRVMALHQDVQQLQKVAYAPARNTSKAELQVTDGAKTYSRSYESMAECQTAMQAALKENDRRKAEMDAYNTAQEENVRVNTRPGYYPGQVTMSDYIHVSAYCLPV